MPMIQQRCKGTCQKVVRFSNTAHGQEMQRVGLCRRCYAAAHKMRRPIPGRQRTVRRMLAVERSKTPASAPQKAQKDKSKRG